MTCYRGFLLGSCRRVAGGRAALRGSGSGADGRRHLGHGQPRELAGGGSPADGGFRPSRVVVVAKTTRYEFEQQRYRYAELSEEDLKQLVGPGGGRPVLGVGVGGDGPQDTPKARQPSSDCLWGPSGMGLGRPEPALEGAPGTGTWEATCVLAPASVARTPIAEKMRVVRPVCPGDLSPDHREKGNSPAQPLVAERGPKCRGHTPFSPGDRGLARESPAGLWSPVPSGSLTA